MSDASDHQLRGREDWDALCAEVRDEMAAFVSRYSTPISESEDFDSAMGLGTGSYITLGRSAEIHLLTNEHVAARARHRMLAHLPTWGANYEALASEIRYVRHPYDIAVAPVASERIGGDRSVLTAELLDGVCAPVENELLFWLGYPGTSGGRFDPPTQQNRRVTMYGVLPLPGVPVVSQQIPQWPDGTASDFDERLHLLVHYPERAWRQPGQPDAETPSPHGMSGSLLWDTKVVACERDGVYWTPEHARVCGLIWATCHSPACVAATKVEHVRAWLEAEGLSVAPSSAGE